MIRYLIRLLVLCAVGAAAVWFGMPAFKKAAPRPYAQLASILLGRPVAIDGTSQVATGLGENAPDIDGFMRKANAIGEKAVAKANIPAAKSAADVFKNRKKTASTNDVSPAAGAAAAANGTAIPEGARTETQPDGSVVVYVEEEIPPDPRGALNDDPGFPMGVVATNSFYYDARGRKLGSMPGGTVVENLETAQAGDILVCKTLVFHPKKRIWQETAVWFEASDLVLLNAPYQDLPRAERDALVDYCAAKGAWIDAYNKLAAKVVARWNAAHKNPYEAEYQAAKAKHDALMERIRENDKKIKWSQTHDDPKRPAYLREGQKLAGEQRDDARVWNPIRQKWQAWEDEHGGSDDDGPGSYDPAPVRPGPNPVVRIPGNGEAVEIRETPDMEAWRAKMDELAPVVRAIAPDL